MSMKCGKPCQSIVTVGSVVAAGATAGEAGTAAGARRARVGARGAGSAATVRFRGGMSASMNDTSIACFPFLLVCPVPHSPRRRLPPGHKVSVPRRAVIPRGNPITLDATGHD